MKVSKKWNNQLLNLWTTSVSIGKYPKVYNGGIATFVVTETSLIGLKPTQQDRNQPGNGNTAKCYGLVMS